MSADLLREAAALMRARAQAATPGAWNVGGRTNVCVGASDSRFGFSADAIIADLDSMSRTDYDTDEFEWRTEADAEHIASWHPAVALAVAALLDDAAEFCETNPSHKHGAAKGELHIARAYLGRDQ